MKILHTTIRVADLDRSLEFYNALLGVEPRARFKAGPNEIAFIGDGEAALELIEGPEGSGSYSLLSIGVACEDVEARLAQLQAEGFETTPLIRPNPNVCFFFVTDPDGLQVQCSNEYTEGRFVK